MVFANAFNYLFNARTMLIKSIVHKSIAMTPLKNLILWRGSKPGLKDLKTLISAASPKIAILKSAPIVLSG
jgi:hypothetical protein